MALSIVVTAAFADQYRERHTRENFVLATACISLIVALFYTIAHFFETTKNAFVGNVMETGKRHQIYSSIHIDTTHL